MFCVMVSGFPELEVLVGYTEKKWLGLGGWAKENLARLQGWSPVSGQAFAQTLGGSAPPLFWEGITSRFGNGPLEDGLPEAMDQASTALKGMKSQVEGSPKTQYLLWNKPDILTSLRATRVFMAGYLFQSSGAVTSFSLWQSMAWLNQQEIGKGGVMVDTGRGGWQIPSCPPRSSVDFIVNSWHNGEPGWLSSFQLSRAIRNWAQKPGVGSKTEALYIGSCAELGRLFQNQMQGLACLGVDFFLRTGGAPELAELKSVEKDPK